MESTVMGKAGQRVTVVADTGDHAVLTVLRDGVPIGALDRQADGTVTWGVFDAEGDWLA